MARFQSNPRSSSRPILLGLVHSQVNSDIKELESILDESYGGSLISRVGHVLLKVLNGFENRLRELEKRFEDTEG